MSLVPITGLKDFLTGSIWDKFKELIEPYALVNATIFIVLNLILVVPAIGSLGKNSIVGLLTTATTESSTDGGNLDIWRFILGTILVFVFSYTINHLSPFFLNLASGEVFRDSLIIGRVLKWWQLRLFNALQDDASPEKERDLSRIDKATFRLAYEFPVYQNELALTKLGNHLLNPSSYIAHQYGMHMRMVWPIILEKLPDDNKTLKLLQGNWTSILFFTSLQGLLFFVSIELIVVTAFVGKVINLWQIAGLLILVALCYYTAREKALQWGRGMRHLFDSHAREVFTDMGMDALKDLNPSSVEYKERWTEVLKWLAYGAIRNFQFTAKTDWYKKDTSASSPKLPQLKHPEFLKVETLPPYISNEMFCRKDGNIFICVEQTAHYLFAVTNTSIGENPLTGKDAYLLVQDDSVLPPETVVGYISKLRQNWKLQFDQIVVIGKRQQGNPAGVLFPLGNLPPGASIVLTYTLDSSIAKVTAEFEISNVILQKSKTEKPPEYFVDVIPSITKQPQKATITIKIPEDAQKKVNPYAELFFTSSERDLREFEDGKNSRSWNLTLEPEDELEKVRIRIGG
jgi:hypothetical protein